MDGFLYSTDFIVINRNLKNRKRPVTLVEVSHVHVCVFAANSCFRLCVCACLSACNNSRTGERIFKQGVVKGRVVPLQDAKPFFLGGGE